MTSIHIDSDVTRLQSMPGTLKSDWDLNSTDAKTPKIELEIIMSDVAIIYLGAFCQFENFHVYYPQGGCFLVKYKFIINSCCFAFIFAFATFEISPNYASLGRYYMHLGAVSRTIVKYDSVSYGKKPITDDIRNSENAFLESSVYFPF